jgi:capsular polysaccharide biosynthesis protein/cellulose biosynthesis protein BcsQ
VSQQDSVYRASMSMVVGVEGTELRPPELGGPQLTQTVRNMIHSDLVSRQVSDNLQLNMNPKTFASKLHVAVDPSSSVVRVSFDSTNASQALRVVQELSGIFNDVVAQRLLVEVPVAPPSSVVDGRQSGVATTTAPGAQLRVPLVFVRVFDPPHVEQGRVSPKPLKTIGFAAGLGLIVGLLIAVARERLDTRIRTTRDAERWFDAPVAAALPRQVVNKPSLLLANSSNETDVAPEELRFLGAIIVSVYAPQPGSVILVTAAARDEQKSETASSLAIVLARARKDVICVDADSEPTMHRLLGVDVGVPHRFDRTETELNGEPLLRSVPLWNRRHSGEGPQSNPARVSRAMGSVLALTPAGERPTPHLVEPRGRLRLLTPMPTNGQAANEFSEDQLSLTIDALRSRADYLVIDTSPLPTGLSFKLATKADHVIVVARTNTTTRERAENVRRLLDRLGAKDVSIVLLNDKGARHTLRWWRDGAIAYTW